MHNFSISQGTMMKIATNGFEGHLHKYAEHSNAFIAM